MAGPEPKHTEPAGKRVFPTAWLTPMVGKYVIDAAHWNEEPVPETDAQQMEFSVQWSRFYGTNFLTCRVFSIEVIGIVLNLYFNISGCIIPVAFIPDSPNDRFVFTIAGPCDDDGKKPFYLFHHDSPVSANKLYRFGPAFSSVADFYQNRKVDGLQRIPPQADMEEKTEKALVDCGFQDALEPMILSDDSDDPEE
ncbi:hypothetical protein C8R45DRAFT_1094304 [Mycena sanguinolenta]|nr:hypothetical protein C8R45DRAFT_1094304 [Mycena sanguinolenta]